MTLPSDRTLTTYNIDVMKVHGDTPAVQVSYSLHIEEVSSAITRSPVLFALPADTSDSNPFNNLPRSWGLDLGMLTETWQLTGIIDDYEDAVLTPAFITKTQFDDMARVAGTGATGKIHSQDQHKVDGPVAVNLHAGSGHNQGAGVTDTWHIPGFILTATATRKGGNSWWEFIMRVSVTVWSPGMQTNISPT